MHCDSDHLLAWCMSQAEQQISQAAEAVVAVKQELAKEKARRAIQQAEQHAAAALAAQLPRLELYSQIKVGGPGPGE